jgi:RHS repeat-associated protein
VKTYDYIEEFVYEDNTLSYIIHPEGRVANENSTLTYEFFVKDHLGNVCQVVRAPQSAFRIATMEPENAEQKEEDFQNIKESRQGAGEHNKTPGGYSTAWLNADRGRILGPSRSQEVQQGDSVEIGVFGKYVDSKKIKLSPATFVRTGLDRKIIRTLGEYGQTLSAVPNELAIANVIALVISELETKLAPEAYMGYALYDADSVLYEQGKVVLSKKARNKHEELIEKIAVTKDGYIETYLVNETAENVWFDQFRVMSTGPLIVQETHYDPWGVELSGLGYQYGGIKVNPYLYQGKELMDNLSLNIYDFHARGYDPAIGRTWHVDPLAELDRKTSPYVYVFNNPLRFIDPDGRFGDYYDNQGSYLGNDGIDDDKVYQLRENYRANTANTNVNWGGQLAENHSKELQSKSNDLGTVQDAFVTGDAVSDKRIQSMHPSIRMQATNFIKEANANSDGTLIRVAQGFRTYAEQDALYAQGRTALGNIVTNAKGGFSNHNFGLAFDIVGITNGKMDYNLDWKTLSTLGKSKGFEWGGDWKFKDMPHFENMFGNGLKELRVLPKDQKGFPILKP